MTQTIPLDPSMIAYGCKCLRQCSARSLRRNFMQPLAICGFLRKALVWRILSTRVSVVVCVCSAQRRDSYTPELLPPKGNHQKGAKGNQKGTKESQKGAKGIQKGAKDQENHQKSCFGAFEVFFFFFAFFLKL